MHGQTSGSSHIDSPSIDESLQRVLRSAHFKDALQLQTLLKYIVENSILGHDDALKERIIGIKVFGRKPDYDTAIDPIVRSRVGLLRKRLEQYYESDEVENSEIQIVIPHGSYRPTFVLHPDAGGGSAEIPVAGNPKAESHHNLKEHPEPQPDSSSIRRPGPRRSRAARRRMWVLAAVATCVVLAAAWLIGIQRAPKSELDLFWQPLLATKRPVVIYIGAARGVYFPRVWAPVVPPGEEALPLKDWNVPPPAKDQVLTGKDLAIDNVNFTGVGEAKADARLAELLATHGISFSLRSGPSLAFEDLRGSPAILLGAFTNFWNLDLNSDLPFFYDRSMQIRERGGQARTWSLALEGGASPAEDYAVVSRIFNPKTGSPEITLAGMTTCGTGAAAEFVTNPAQLKKLADIPRDALEHKNIEIVLHAHYVDCTPTSMDIVAVRFW